MVGMWLLLHHLLLKLAHECVVVIAVAAYGNDPLAKHDAFSPMGSGGFPLRGSLVAELLR